MPYVGDINMATTATPPGLRYENKKLYVDENAICEEQTISADKPTMLLVQESGNDIHSSIQLEVDFPSKHEDGEMPILDLKAWIEQHENQTVIVHECYSKDVASKAVMNVNQLYHGVQSKQC